MSSEPTRLTVEDANAVLATQPFNAQVGARCTALVRGEAELEIDVDERHKQQHGTVHGGVLAYAVDNALAMAGGSVLGPRVVTAGFSVNFVRAARGGVLRARAVVLHASSRQAVCSAELRAFGADGSVELCAVAQGTIAAIR
ncbi:PaaI family thioesterase [Actinokineospora bangkokensis]|uniref:Medium/long-chain acyl-CoA thioesterase YigI n=1 Tax=Actinokineospora bangkokensis TaxID=1193682 RepID=A0A1Q9LS70_9PSEU|nr:PaaI family thioesterase [Actinokineospora bangkokensis]OLR94886.1 thioesterase [Actinokineospora bangkokensis]